MAQLNDAASLFSESNIHRHQSLYETMCQAYTEVHSNSKKLLYQLDHLVQVSNQTKKATTNHVSKKIKKSVESLRKIGYIRSSSSINHWKTTQMQQLAHFN